MLAESQNHLSTRHITVNNGGTIESDDDHEIRLTVILSKRPRIANYVRSLEIKMDNSTPWDVTLSEGLLFIFSALNG